MHEPSSLEELSMMYEVLRNAGRNEGRLTYLPNDGRGGEGEGGRAFDTNQAARVVQTFCEMKDTSPTCDKDHRPMNFPKRGFYVSDFQDLPGYNWKTELAENHRKRESKAKGGAVAKDAAGFAHGSEDHAPTATNQTPVVPAPGA